MDYLQVCIEIEAYSRMVKTYYDIMDQYGGTDEYIEQRIHLLNCKYAELLVKRAELEEAQRAEG